MDCPQHTICFGTAQIIRGGGSGGSLALAYIYKKNRAIGWRNSHFFEYEYKNVLRFSNFLFFFKHQNSPPRQLKSHHVYKSVTASCCYWGTFHQLYMYIGNGEFETFCTNSRFVNIRVIALMRRDFDRSAVIVKYCMYSLSVAIALLLSTVYFWF